MMKRRIGLFFSLALGLLAILPLLNIAHSGLSRETITQPRTLYRLDPVIPYLSQWLLPLGVSPFAEQVVVGQQGWLFLGDRYAHTLSAKRQPALAAQVAPSAAALTQWRRYVQQRGVMDMYLMIGPDKGSVYSHRLPRWATPQPPSHAALLAASPFGHRVINPTAALQAQRDHAEDDLYYRTDTHWNALGAWQAFDTLMAQLQAHHPALRHPLQARYTGTVPTDGGDLADFLRLGAHLVDKEPQLALNATAQVRQYRWPENTLVAEGGPGRIGTQREPLQVVSDNAANPLRVLWLRDSFGTALAPYMALTFAETLQLDYDRTPPARFAELVEGFAPDLVIITAVERNLNNDFFTALPPAE